jgi:stage II sporulation protein AA (anti-sigma F factor antagonist)
VRLCLIGDLDMSTVDLLQDCLEGLDRGVRRVILDLDDLTFLDSTGLNLFVHAHQRFGPELRELVLMNPPASARRVLELSAIDQLIPIAHDRTYDLGMAAPA